MKVLETQIKSELAETQQIDSRNHHGLHARMRARERPCAEMMDSIYGEMLRRF